MFSGEYRLIYGFWEVFGPESLIFLLLGYGYDGLFVFVGYFMLYPVLGLYIDLIKITGLFYGLSRYFNMYIFSIWVCMFMHRAFTRFFLTYKLYFKFTRNRRRKCEVHSISWNSFHGGFFYYIYSFNRQLCSVYILYTFYIPYIYIYKRIHYIHIEII